MSPAQNVRDSSDPGQTDAVHGKNEEFVSCVTDGEVSKADCGESDHHEIGRVEKTPAFNPVNNRGWSYK